MEKALSNMRQSLVRLTAGLDAMSPLKVLARGYSMTKDEAGHVITNADHLRAGDVLHITLHKGSITAEVVSSEGE